MADSPIPLEGSCGAVRIRITAEPLVTMARHCTECQRVTACPLSLGAAIPTPGLAIAAGTPIRGGKKSLDFQHFYRTDCKSWLFTNMTGRDIFVNLRAAILDAPGNWATPFAGTYTSEKLGSVTAPARHSLPQSRPMAAWEGLCRNYTVEVRT